MVLEMAEETAAALDELASLAGEENGAADAAKAQPNAAQPEEPPDLKVHLLPSQCVSCLLWVTLQGRDFFNLGNEGGGDEDAGESASEGGAAVAAAAEEMDVGSDKVSSPCFTQPALRL